jgi:sugar phosphate permease
MVLSVAYGSMYLCRASLSVTTPLIARELGPNGVGVVEIGVVASIGLAAYAVGKLVSGAFADRLGGRRVLLTAMFGAAAASVATGATTSYALFASGWTLNRVMQSPGWNAVVKVASGCVPTPRIGLAMGLVSLSFLFGDSIARVVLGGFLAAGLSWRGVFALSGVTLAIITVAVARVLREPPPPAPVEIPGSPQQTSPSLRASFVSAPLWSIAGLSAGLTFLREALTFWTPFWLASSYQVAPAQAAFASALIPLSGGVASLVVGALSDRDRSGHRLKIALPFLLVMAGLLWWLSIGAPSSAAAALSIACAVAFALTGPYVLLAGAVAIDLGGPAKSATTAGVIDGVGYLGAVVAGATVAAISVHSGWPAVFGVLAWVGTAICVWVAGHVTFVRAVGRTP